ncbi:hypothetical protein J1605_005728 [Eschrichtius robustus]|uniref:Uncharacterized protein n=1 Tax=Eschrichtius robustus TaxID=9764 RepID=A0AB34H4Z6_ESCRO|nr:hypothetical protein J1605_005728 [Eschrichtius robustus]
MATKTPHTPSRICQPWALGARSDPCERAWKARCGPQSRVRPHAATLNPAEQKEASSQERGERPPEEQASGGWPCPAPDGDRAGTNGRSGGGTDSGATTWGFALLPPDSGCAGNGGAALDGAEGTWGGAARTPGIASRAPRRRAHWRRRSRVEARAARPSPRRLGVNQSWGCSPEPPRGRRGTGRGGPAEPAAEREPAAETTEADAGRPRRRRGEREPPGMFSECRRRAEGAGGSAAWAVGAGRAGGTAWRPGARARPLLHLREREVSVGRSRDETWRMVAGRTRASAVMPTCNGAREAAAPLTAAYGVRAAEPRGPERPGATWAGSRG